VHIFNLVGWLVGLLVYLVKDYGKHDANGDHGRANQGEVECALIPRKGENVINEVHVIG